MDHKELIGHLEACRLVPVVKLDRAEDAVPLAQALIRGGLPVAEITFRTEAAEESIRRITEVFPEMLVGAGTVINTSQAERAVRAGARFLVSPGISDELAQWATEHGVPLLPGVCTPSEIMKAVSNGLTILKFFPAGQYGGLQTIKALGGPFPQVRFMPTGGVNAANIAEYLKDPRVIACGGSWMVKDSLIRDGNFDEITRLTAEAVSLTRGSINMLVLAIESSTSSTKSLLYDTEKRSAVSVRESYGAIHHAGMTDTEKVFQLTMKKARELAQGQDIAAIALCGTWHGLCALDGDCRPASPTYSWDFLGTAPYVDQIQKNEELTDIFYRRTGCMPHNTYPRHIFSYLRDQGMKMEGHKFLTQGAYHFYRLTGELRESRCTQSGSGLINLDSLEYDEFILNYFGVRKEQLGELCDYRDVAPLSSEGAELLGLRPGIPVVPAHADGALNQLGSYAHRPGVMTMSVGTSGAMRLVAERPVLPENRGLWCYLGVEGYISGAAVSGACNCIDWFRKGLLGGRMSFEELEQGTDNEREVPIFLPFLFSERCPGWRSERQGSFLEVDGSHTPGDLYKAVQMGILMNMFQCYRILSQENCEPSEILLSGGINNSAVWTQMAADIFERELLVMDCPDASTMGAVALALYTAGALEKIGDFRSDYDKAVRIRPDSQRYTYYRKQYKRYLDAYKKNGEREI